MSLQEAKDQIAKKYGYDSWAVVDFYQIDAMNETRPGEIDAEHFMVNQAAELYALNLSENYDRLVNNLHGVNGDLVKMREERDKWKDLWDDVSRRNMANLEEVKEYKSLYEDNKARFEFYRDCFDQEQQQNTLLAQKCSDYADQITQCEIDRANLVAMTLERDEFDEANKKLAGELRSYKQWLREREESMKRMEQEIKVLETKIQFLEPYKELYEEYKARYEFEENPPEIEEIFVTSSSPEDVYAAFIDKARAQWDAKESGTELCSIKLHRGTKGYI